MMRILLLSLSFLICSVTIAQINPQIDTKNLFSNKIGQKEAWKSFNQAESYYKKGEGLYDEALKHYLRVYNYNPANAALNFKIGVCYLSSSNKKTALKYLKESSPLVSKKYYLMLGRAYQYNLDYTNAKQAYIDYLAQLKKWQQFDAKKRIDQLIAECENGALLMQDSLPAYIINLGPIVNSYYDDYAPYIAEFDQALYYTSKRPVNEPSRRVSRFSFNERVLLSQNALDGNADNVDDIKQTRASVNMSMAGIDKNTKQFYVYKGKKDNGSIMVVEFKKGKWAKPKKLAGSINHIAYKETSFSCDNAGNAYFVSDRRGGFGGKDIWVAKHKKGHRYGEAINIGDIINTPFDEEGVYITKDGNTIFFSSKGHQGLGGYDVYKSVKVNNEWTKPVNLGHPVNSPADELFYFPTADSLVALYSTIRQGGYGGYDIYKIQVDKRVPFKLIGSVVDSANSKTLAATVTIYDKNTNKVIKQTGVDEYSGIYMIDFDDAGNYGIQVSYDGYKSISADIICPKIKYSTEVYDYKLEKLKSPFTLSGIVTDIDNHKPISAEILIKDPVTNQVLSRTNSLADNGAFRLTFEDKFDMVIDVNAKNYFGATLPVNAKNETNSVINQNFELKISRVDYTVSGLITDDKGQKAVYAALSFYKPGNSEPYTIVVSDSITGKYTAIFDNSGPYIVEVESNGYFFANDAVSFNQGETVAIKNFGLKKMDTGVKIVIKNIIFNTGKTTLRSESFVELDKLANLLDKNPDIRIEVSGHTDNVGSSSVNKKISKLRALTVKNYLVSRGIIDDRIEYEGYGFDQPIAPNDTPEGREQNRRVEIKVLGQKDSK